MVGFWANKDRPQTVVAEDFDEVDHGIWGFVGMVASASAGSPAKRSFVESKE